MNEIVSSCTSSGRASSETRSERVRQVIRDVAVFGASVGVLVGLVIFAFAAPTNELVADVGSVVRKPTTAATVEGRVLDAAGDGVGGAEVGVRHVGGGRRAGTARTDRTGAFRLVLSGGCGSYAVRIAAQASGDDVQTTAHRRLCPGDVLPIEARIVTRGHFLWVPGPR